VPGNKEIVLNSRKQPKMRNQQKLMPRLSEKEPPQTPSHFVEKKKCKHKTTPPFKGT